MKSSTHLYVGKPKLFEEAANMWKADGKNGEHSTLNLEQKYVGDIKGTYQKVMSVKHSSLGEQREVDMIPQVTLDSEMGSDHVLIVAIAPGENVDAVFHGLDGVLRRHQVQAVL